MVLIIKYMRKSNWSSASGGYGLGEELCTPFSGEFENFDVETKHLARCHRGRADACGSMMCLRASGRPWM